MLSSSDRIQAVKELLGSNLSPDAQWRSVERFLAADLEGKGDILRWLFAHHKGFVEVRARAGADLMRSHRHEVWKLIQDLVKSHDPDDRDTALTLLAQHPSASSFEMARPLLNDPWPYIRLEAVDYLKRVYPFEALQALREFEQHNEEWVRNAVRTALEGLG
jgi:HEAT repeat protein